VKNTADWRVQFDKRPMVMLGVAFGAGLLAATVIPLGGRSRKLHTSSYSGYSAGAGTGSYTGSSALSQAYTGSQGYSGSSEGGTGGASSKQPSKTRKEMRKAWGMVDDIRATLIALGSSRLRDRLGQAIPGFQEHYRNTAENRDNQSGEERQSVSYSEPSHTGSQSGRPGQGSSSLGTGHATGTSNQPSQAVQDAFSTGTGPSTESRSSKPKQTR